MLSLYRHQYSLGKGARLARGHAKFRFTSPPTCRKPTPSSYSSINARPDSGHSADVQDKHLPQSLGSERCTPQSPLCRNFTPSRLRYSNIFVKHCSGHYSRLRRSTGMNGQTQGAIPTVVLVQTALHVLLGSHSSTLSYLSYQV